MAYEQSLSGESRILARKTSAISERLLTEIEVALQEL